MINCRRYNVEYPFLTEPLEVVERENGHKIILAHKEGELVNISTWVNTGSINEDEKITGISHFVEHVMFKGTSKYKAGYFDKYLEGKGGIVNAATWKDYTFYYVTMPKGENFENLYKLIELHADMMLDPQFPEDELGKTFDLNAAPPAQKRERHVVIEEINMRNDQPWSRVYNLMNNQLYTNHPYKMDVIGTADVISSVSRETIFDYYTKFYAPNNMVTIVVGDFNKDEIAKKVAAAFDFKDRKQAIPTVYELDAAPEQMRYVEETANIQSGFLIYGFLGAKADNIKDNICLDMLSIILGDGQSSRLYTNLIENVHEPKVNYICSEHYQFKDGGTFLVQASFRPEFKDDVLELINKELTQLVENGVEKEEFLKAKNRIKATFAQNAETVSDIADTIGHYAIVCNNIGLVNEYLKIQEQISAEDIVAVAKKYVLPQFASVAVLLPE